MHTAHFCLSMCSSSLHLLPSCQCLHILSTFAGTSVRISVKTSARTSIGISVETAVKTSMLVSWSAFWAKSPADPTLDGNDDRSAKETSISREVLLDQDNVAEASTECAEKVMPVADRQLMIDSMHWQIYPRVGFLGPASVIHWRVMRTIKACFSAIDITFASVGARCELTMSLISLLRLNSLQGSSGHAPFLILHPQNQIKMAAIYWISSSFWIYANSILHGGSHIFWTSKWLRSRHSSGDSFGAMLWSTLGS